LKVNRAFLLGASAALLLISVSAAAATDSASPPSGQQAHRLRREVPHKVAVQYLLFLPKGYEKSQERWPLILYLHGGSVRGDDIAQMKRWGLTGKVEANPDFPFIVVSPQCQKGEIWTDVEVLGAILDEIARTCRVDPDRVT
jgi:predicted peptidase